MHGLYPFRTVNDSLSFLSECSPDSLTCSDVFLYFSFFLYFVPFVGVFNENELPFFLFFPPLKVLGNFFFS